MSLSTAALWQGLQQAGKFEQDKADLSMLAMPEILPKIKPANIEDAMSDKTPTIATARKYQGEEVAKYAVVEIVSQAAALLSISRNLQTHQVEFLADEILRDWYWLTLAEIRFFMLEGVRGKYGAIYDRLDVNVVLDWLAQYSEQRTAIAEKMQREKRIEQEAGDAKPMPEWFLDFIKKHTLQNEQKTKGEFTPDGAFWEQVEREWMDTTEKNGLSFEQFKQMRLAQTKTLLKR